MPRRIKNFKPAELEEEIEEQQALTREEMEGLDILQLMEQVNKVTFDSKLDKARLKRHEALLTYVADKVNLSVNEVILLAALIEGVEEVKLEDLSRAYDCSILKILQMKKDIDSLIAKRFIKKSTRYDDKTVYNVNPTVLNAFSENRPYKGEDAHFSNDKQLLKAIGRSMEEAIRRERIGAEDLLADIHFYLDHNEELPLVEKLRKLSLDDEDLVVLLMMLCVEVFFRWKVWDYSSDMDDMRYGHQLWGEIYERLAAGNGRLFKEKFIQYHCSDRLADKDKVEMCKGEKRTELIGEILPKQKMAMDQDRIRYASIKPKQLYYNPEERKQVEQLQDLLSPKSLKKVSQAMEAKGLGRAFTCLFYGAPGTGKTETAKQLAYMTKRDVLQIDMSQLRDKFVGESEKNVKEIFERYYRLACGSKRTPILLLNEADALIGRRMTGNLRSVDKMENALQNILLQEMENFVGILIATTNMVDNFDGAFERRFLFKIRFNNPTLEAKKAIWKSKLSELDDRDIEKLAAEFDMSGGQIDNVVRKYVMEAILSKETPSYEGMRSMCRGESLKSSRRSIGF